MMVESSMVEKIMEKNYCSKAESSELMADIQLLDNKLKLAFEAWICDKPFVNVSVGDYSIISLITDYNMEFTGALLTLDWLCKDPEMAKKALKYGIR